jgi:hypothetical protein
MPRSLCLPFLLVLLALLGCADRETSQEEAAAPADNGRTLTPEEQARAIAGDPRMLLFDLQTALEAVHEANGAYPTTVEFQLEDRWEFQRAALGAAFSSWEYASDGTTYRLSGEAEGRRLEIASPS